MNSANHSIKCCWLDSPTRSLASKDWGLICVTLLVNVSLFLIVKGSFCNNVFSLLGLWMELVGHVWLTFLKNRCMRVFTDQCSLCGAQVCNCAVPANHLRNETSFSRTCNIPNFISYTCIYRTDLLPRETLHWLCLHGCTVASALK